MPAKGSPSRPGFNALAGRYAPAGARFVAPARSETQDAMPDRGGLGDFGRDEKQALLRPLPCGHLGAGERLALTLGGGQHIIAEGGTAALFHGSIVR